MSFKACLTLSPGPSPLKGEGRLRDAGADPFSWTIGVEKTIALT